MVAPAPSHSDLIEGFPPGERRGLAEALVSRLTTAIRRTLRASSAGALKEALSAPSDVGALARLLTDAAETEAVREIDPLAAAFLRGARMQEEMLVEAGGAWPVSRVAEHLGVTPEAVHRRRRRGTLLAVKRQDTFLYPAAQFDASGVLDGLGEVLRAIDSESSWTKLSVLLSPAPLGTRESVFDELRAGDVDVALHAARTWGDQGAP